MFKTRKILSLALTLTMLLSAVFCTGAVANAEDTAATLPTTSVVKQLNLATAEADMDWSSLGTNLIPDSTVAEFDSNKTYKKYYNDGTTTVANPNAWWRKAIDTHQYSLGAKAWMGFADRDEVSSSEADSHTADGSGAIKIVEHNDRRRLHLSTITAGESYYILTFWAKASKAVSLGATFTHISEQSTSNDTSLALTTDWNRYTILVYEATQSSDYVDLHIWNQNPTVYIDEVEQYKVSTDYAQACIDANALLPNGDVSHFASADSTHKALYTASNWESRNYHEIDFSAFGENLVPDPTVNEFVSDGNGGKVYDSYYVNDDKNSGTDNTKAWWGKHVNSAANQKAGDMWSSPKTHGAVVYDPSLSHTDDGSGVIKLDSTNGLDVNLTLPMPAMEKYSYYLITYWVKGSKNYETRLGYNLLNNGSYSEYAHKNLDAYYESSWRRVTAIVYTGNHKSNQPYVGTYYSKGSNTLYMDDFGVYKLDAAYATQCMTAGQLLAPASFDANASTENKAVKVPNFTEFDETKLGVNLVTDPTVAKFTDGVYNSYSWWNTAPFTHESSMYHSMASRGFVTKETSLSHTADGSGAIVVPKQTNAVFYIPVAQAGTYYLISFWVKASGNVQSAPHTNGVSLYSGGKFSESVNGWQKISWILYAGTTAAIPACSMFIYGSSSDVIFDDVSVQIMDYDYGKECIATGAPAAATTVKDTTEVAAAGTKDLTVTDGYFVPYGAATIGSTMLEKLGNGRFYASTTGTVNYTQFKYPTGVVGTFGVSVKTTDDTGIQFGSLVTDNLSTKSHGTLVIRGDFDAFRATLPSYTREQIFNILYNNLKTNNIASGEAVNVGNAGEVIAVMYVDRTKYMWKNSENTELQYAVRLYNVEQNFADVEYTAVGYVTTADDELVFSNTIKSDKYSNHVSN